MKLFSKLISAVAALSMVASIAIMPAVHADATTLKLSAAPNADEGYVDLTVSYSGAVAKMQTSGVVINIGDKFKAPECPEDYEGDYWSALVDDEIEGWSTAKTGLDGVTFAVQATAIKFATFTSKTTAKTTLDADCENLLTVRLVATDDSVWKDGYEFTLGASTLGDFDSSIGTLTLDDEDAVIEGKGPGPEPKPETIKETGDEEATDKAVGLGKEFESITGDLEYKLTATKGGDKFDFVKTFAMALVEGKAKVGVIVTYNGADYDDVELAFVGMK